MSMTVRCHVIQVEDLCEGSKSVVDWTQTGLIWNGQDDESWVNLLTFAGFIVEVIMIF